MVRSVNPEGTWRHDNPIPAAAVHRGILISSAISGRDPVTGAYPADKTEQINLAFRILKQVLEAGKACPQDVVKFDLYVSDKADRPLVNPHWVQMYPEEDARPARHSHVAELPLGCCLQIVVCAVLEDR